MSDKYPGKTIIGLTGNIATGKSLVRRMLEHLGAFGIDADSLVRRAMSPGAPAYEPIVANFGKYILDKNGQIDRQKLARIVFTDPEALRVLESLTHPIVRQVIGLLIRRAKQDIVVVEAIKLFEGGLADECDLVWVVDAPRDVQLTRLTRDRGMSEEEATMRIDAQTPQVDKLARANVVINNAGNYEATYRQVKEQLKAVSGGKLVEEAIQQPQVVTKADEGEVQISILRGGPGNADSIAKFINRIRGTSLSRMDVMMKFGQQAYMLAMAENEIVGLAGWQVENLITRIPEFVLDKSAPVKNTVKSLLSSVEQASSDLQSEIVLLFLPVDIPAEPGKVAEGEGYESKETEDLKVPDWREAARDSAPETPSKLLAKRLRADRVLKPI